MTAHYLFIYYLAVAAKLKACKTFIVRKASMPFDSAVHQDNNTNICTDTEDTSYPMLRHAF